MARRLAISIACLVTLVGSALVTTAILHSADRDSASAAVTVIAERPTGRAARPERAPQPGEILTIAGYGSGQYRAASGVCTQYVAPGLEFPYEMVEVAVSARQGDSGGPIFNARGELAGVLFGEGDGRTSGSYCGRVRWFLTRIVPNLPTTPSSPTMFPMSSSSLCVTGGRRSTPWPTFSSSMGRRRG